jgi:D-alanyl-D-alanine carboxypeptidase
MYEAWFGMIDPPRDYTVFDISLAGPAASLISTVADLNRFYGMLLAREILNASSLGHMRRTVVISFEENRVRPRTTQDGDPSHSTFWGHDGTVWGAGALTMTRADGKRQMSVAVNFIRANKLDSSGEAAAPSHR